MKLSILLLLILLTMQGFSQSDPYEGMVLIPAGEFIMGKDSKNNADFSPAHKVKVDSFYIDAYEVSNAEYQKFCQETGHKLPEFWNVDFFRCGEKYPDYPVVGINWYDANKYARWAGKRLPTEAEWEYAARGGLKDKEFPNGNQLQIPPRRNESPGEWENHLLPVGSFEPNAYGLYDMAGNVWEWTGDKYQYDFYQISDTDNPKGPKTGTNFVIRGGSWHSGKMCHKVYYRKGLTSNWVDFAVGFRCVKDI
jgi:iron(II)-dependent oxidoreductase